ncbi:MAG: hypothetical protein BGO07_03830 [Alphaproteobacteria bacterium 40-19]|nr:MAG: hypothetical protein BGO07_03830 [Alphaproteobacteria bacterium 40-19]
MTNLKAFKRSERKLFYQDALVYFGGFLMLGLGMSHMHPSGMGTFLWALWGITLFRRYFSISNSSLESWIKNKLQHLDSWEQHHVEKLTNDQEWPFKNKVPLEGSKDSK